MRTPFEAAVREHGETVFRVVRVLLPPADAEDAWSETFLAALRAWPELPPDSDVRAWLVTIAHRKAIDQLRRRPPVPVGELPERGQPSAGLGAADPVWDLVRALPPKQRQVVAYRFLGDLAYAEIAALVGGTPEAARRSAADAMKTLRARREELR